MPSHFDVIVIGGGHAGSEAAAASALPSASGAWRIWCNNIFDDESKGRERAAIEAVLKASGDSWANYFPKSALKVLDEANTNSYSGIGATLRKSRGGVIEVSGIAPQSPAAEAGLAVGDQVIEINSTDVQGASLSSAIALIRGALGDKVELKIVRDGQQKLVSLVARQISALNVEATQVSSKVGLVSINNFTAGTALQVETALRGLKVDDGLIIDLRGNPGGLVEEAVRVAQIFIGNGTIVSYRVSGNEKVYSAKNSRPIMSPIVVMINKSTARDRKSTRLNSSHRT